MEPLYLDTHVAVWLHSGLTSMLSPRARQRLQTARLLISPMVELELEFLHETGRVGAPAEEVTAHLQSAGLEVCQLSLRQVVAESRRQGWTRDPFDRIIVGQASLATAPLLTRDRRIHEHYPRAVWD